MPVDKPVQTQTPKWKYTFAQTQPFKVLGQCNDVEGLGLLNLPETSAILLISFDDGQSFAMVGRVLFGYGQNTLVGLVQQDTAHKNWKESSVVFNTREYWISQDHKDARDIQGQVGDQTPEQLKAHLLAAYRTRIAAYGRWHEEDRATVDKQRGEIENLQRTIKLMREGHDIAMSNAQRVDKNLEDAYVTIQKLEADLLAAQAGRQDANTRIAALEHQHEADVNLAKTQAQVLRGYQQEVNDLKGTISKIAKDRDNLECEKVVAELELTLATRRSDAWELEARRRGYVGGGQ